MMERQQILATMGDLKLFGMKAAYDEIIKAAVKRTHEPQQIVGDLLQAEISEKQARSIRYHMTITKLPLAKDIAEFAFDGTPINEVLVRDLAGGEFLAHQRNVVLVGGTGTGKTHLAIALARACIRGRFYNVVDLVNRLLLKASLTACLGLQVRVLVTHAALIRSVSPKVHGAGDLSVQVSGRAAGRASR